jgi:hypothetical protein
MAITRTTAQTITWVALSIFISSDKSRGRKKALSRLGNVAVHNYQVPVVGYQRPFEQRTKLRSNKSSSLASTWSIL